MQILPAIDLRNQQCVRLYQGDYDQQTTYATDPLAMAEQFKAAGADWLHVVDLDGAKDPAAHQRDLIQQIHEVTGLKIQTGGGIRTQGQVEACLAAGITRVIIGSLAIKEPDLVKSWIHQYGAEHFVLAVDVQADAQQDFYVAMHGWQELSDLKLEAFLQDYTQAGIRHALCTDISRDGTLQGPNVSLYQRILAQFPDLQLQASGGVGSLQDIITLRENHLPACIVGKALYEGKINLQDIIEPSC